MKTFKRLLALALVAFSALSVPAWACGGCFVPPINSTAPILQNAERILFVRDPATKKSTVWVEIRYSGPADGFGWVLPLPKVPKVGVGTSYLFDRLDLGTAPRFQLDSLNSEGCSSGGGSIGCSDASLASSAALDRSNGGGGTVTILQHDQVGPYDYQVIQAKSADDVLTWLNSNGFATPDKAKTVLADHVAKGDVFVAVKLATGKGVDQIKPISLEMDDAEPCVPLRLTAIAAENDTTIQVYVAGPGRAIPKNHLHVRLNPVRLDVLHGAKNYEQVVAAAIDEAAGRAFITEFAGEIPTTISVPSQYPYGSPSQEPLVDYTAIDTTGVAKAKTTCEAWNLLYIHNFPITKETVAIIDPLFHFAAQAGTADALTYYKSLTACPLIKRTDAIDGAALAAQLETEFAAPLRDMTKTLTSIGAGGGSKGRFSRLVMRISPDEMTRDPVFAFSGTLPDVSNVTKGGYGPVCLGDGSTQNGYRVTIAGMGSWLMANQTQTDGTNLPNLALDPRMTKAPAALTIELLDETGEPIAVDASQIALADQAIAGAKWGSSSLPSGTVLKPAAKRWTTPASDAVIATPSSGCIGGHTRQQAPWALAGLLTLAGLALRLRRARK